MPRKKKTTTITEEIPDSEILQPESAIEQDFPEEETLSQVLEQFGHQAQVKVKVSRQTAKGPSYCFSTDGDIDEDFIQAEYGGGLYSCRIFIDGSLRKTIKLNIADRINPASRGTQTPIENIQIQMMREQNAFLMNLVGKAIGGGGSATPVGELADAMKTVHQLSGNGNGNGSRSEIDTLIRGMELAMKFNGNGSAPDWKSELLDTAKEVLKPIVPIVAQHLMKSQQPQVTAVETQQMLPEQQAQLTADQIRQQLALGIAYLKPKALKNSDPGLWVDLVVENADEYGPFIHFVLTSEFAEFARIDTELANEPYATWFKKLYDGLRTAFSDEPEVEDHFQRPDGDSGNVVHNAEFGTVAKSASGKTSA